jgi:hypothetical protein
MGRILASTLALILVCPVVLLAGKPKDKNKDKDKGAAPGVEVTVVFTDSQREAARGYFVEEHGRGGCPPGLAKKHNGCLPPGQAKKRYAVGRAMPKGIVVGSVPAELSVKIGAPPAGYVYAIVDGDLLKLAVGTMLVVDAVEGLVQ